MPHEPSSFIFARSATAITSLVCLIHYMGFENLKEAILLHLASFQLGDLLELLQNYTHYSFLSVGLSVNIQDPNNPMYPELMSLFERLLPSTYHPKISWQIRHLNEWSKLTLQRGDRLGEGILEIESSHFYCECGGKRFHGGSRGLCNLS